MNRRYVAAPAVRDQAKRYVPATGVEIAAVGFAAAAAFVAPPPRKVFGSAADELQHCLGQ